MKIFFSTLLISISFLITSCGEVQRNMNISTQSKKILEVLGEWVQERYTKKQYYDLVRFEDIDLADGFDKMLVDETIELKEWLIKSPAYNMKNLDFSKRKDKFIEFASSDGIIHALWFYPELQDEPPVIKFSSGYYPSVVASSLEEFACRLGKNIDDEVLFDEIDEEHKIGSSEKAGKLLLKDYKKFRKRLARVIDCALFENHAQLMLRHDVVLVPQLSFSKKKNNLEGNKIVELINLPISNINVLNTLHTLGYDTPLYPVKDGGFEIGTSATHRNISVDFLFSDTKETSTQKKDKIETLYMDHIEFDYTCEFMPFELKGTDNFATVAKKLSDFDLYLNPESESTKFWFPKGKEYYIQIDFEEEDDKELYTLMIKTYWSPSRLGLVLSK